MLLEIQLVILSFCSTRVHVFLNGCNFRCRLLENFEVLKRKKTIVVSTKLCDENFVIVTDSYLWLNWFSGNEIMHFLDESRLVGQGNISRAWSDVSIKKTKNRNFQYFTQCSGLSSLPVAPHVFFFLCFIKIDSIFSIFGYFFEITWNIHVAFPIPRTSDYNRPVIIGVLFAITLMSWQTFNATFMGKFRASWKNDCARREDLKFRQDVTIKAIEN